MSPGKVAGGEEGSVKGEKREKNALQSSIIEILQNK